MREILPGVFHWTTMHEGIKLEVHSYYVTAVEPAVLIDPRMPSQGPSWFEDRPRPRHVYLTNRHHYRHSDRFEKAFGCEVWCHRAGLHEFSAGQKVTGFEHGDELPGGILAVEIGVLCPEETTLSIPRDGGILSMGDALIRHGDGLGFVPDAFMGEDPGAVKRGLCRIFRGLLRRDFDHMLFAHGMPLVGGARENLRAFLEGLRV